jgi:hypothetical protein
MPLARPPTPPPISASGTDPRFGVKRKCRLLGCEARAKHDDLVIRPLVVRPPAGHRWLRRLGASPGEMRPGLHGVQGLHRGLRKMLQQI